VIFRFLDRLFLCGREFGDADQIIGDEIEQEVARNCGKAAMFGSAQRAVLLAPAEDALDHLAACL
jgi:hypothetical protein